MNCTDFIHRYSDYDDSLLSQAEREQFASHLGRCPGCARYDRVLRKGRMLARQLPQPEPSHDFVPRLQQRLHDRRRQRQRLAAAPVLGGAAAGLAAVTVMVTALWALALSEHASPGEAAAGARSDAATEPGRDVATGAVPGGWADAATGRQLAAARLAPGTVPRDHTRPGGAWTALPVAEVSVAKGWAAARVDHRVPVAYSPLVTGPPAYRVAGAFPANASIPSHPPD